MTGLQAFAFVILPLAIGAAGAIVAAIYGGRDRNHRFHAGE